MSLNSFYDLLLPGRSPLIQSRRAMVILSRVRLIAGLFALLTPLWAPIDFLVFGSPLAIRFGLLRLLATLAFAAVVIVFRSARSMAAARRGLAALLAVPIFFFLVSQPLLADFDISGQLEQTVAAGYAFLPFVMVAGLSMFPITAVEGAAFSIPLLVTNVIMAFLGYHVMPFETHLGALWLLALLCVVATLAGMSQLHFMQQLIAQASRDGLTQAYTRRVGEELLDLQFELARRSGSSFTVLFIDLDDFKSINDGSGHEEGDEVLRHAALSLRRVLRRGDLLIRWGGEEFVAVMPNTDLGGAAIALRRLGETGLGRRPDGKPLTACIGGAERLADGCEKWAALVEKADQRMYAGKQAGRDRVVLDDQPLEPRPSGTGKPRLRSVAGAGFR